MERQSIRGGGQHGHANSDVGLAAKSERTQGQNPAIWLSKELEAHVGHCVTEDTNLDSHWWALQHLNQLTDLSANKLPSLLHNTVRKIVAAHQPLS